MDKGARIDPDGSFKFREKVERCWYVCDLDDDRELQKLILIQKDIILPYKHWLKQKERIPLLLVLKTRLLVDVLGEIYQR
jgi:hypothetical protein